MNVDYKEIIRPKLTAKRYFHSLCVAEEAVILAEKYGCDTEKAYVAGILISCLVAEIIYRILTFIWKKLSPSVKKFVFKEPEKEPEKETEEKPEENKSFAIGIDVSKWQGLIDWKKVICVSM